MSPNKRVGFATVEIIEFPIILGDNPSVMTGPPLTISWEPQYRIIVNMDVFEMHRGSCRRSEHDLIIDADIREDILIRAGIHCCQTTTNSWIDLASENEHEEDNEVVVQEMVLSPKKKRRRKSLMLRRNEQLLCEIRIQEQEVEEKLHKIQEMLLKCSSHDLVSPPCA